MAPGKVFGGCSEAGGSPVAVDPPARPDGYRFKLNPSVIVALVAEPIVHLLEVVHVEEDDRTRSELPLHALDFVVNAVVKIATVEQASEAIPQS